MSPRLLVMILCLVNLAAGVGVGVVADRTVLSQEHRGGRGGRPDMARMLEKKLDLDADQAKKVRDIYAARRPALEACMREVHPRMEALRQESDAQIRAILRPDQQAKFDDLRREWQQKHAEHEKRERGESASVNSDSTVKEGVR